ncbi:alginate lyase family protein [Flammeovirga pectinis]|nr:alginate lyase family protein [Flammeovirga pectinis]
MGSRYFVFRIKYEISKKTGSLRKKFPVNPSVRSFISVKDWRKSKTPFFINNISIENLDESKIINDYNKILEGKFNFFSAKEYDLGTDYDWITNPDSNFQYDINKHWVDIEDLSKEAGDIKFVWEKSRFSWVYRIIQYDLLMSNDSSSFIFNQIESWIDSNPVNQGPNYKCSQEISLRILNWTYCLFFYKTSEYLTNKLFEKIINSIYWQFDHIYKNIDFSRIAVRNNHAITECMTLFLSKYLYPFIEETEEWSKNGLKWFENEIEYQIYDDGSFLQFSMNYHRVVIQLLTWAIVLSKKNNITLSKTTIERAKLSLNFLFQFQDKNSGYLPNYGANDGALFFPFSTSEYRDYRPQLNSLHCALYDSHLYSDFKSQAEATFYGYENLKVLPKLKYSELISFKTGGYYGFRIQKDDIFCLIRCASYKDRPSQSDNLHFDLFYKGENLLIDAGSFKYNTKDEYINYFNGTQSHNTCSLEGYNQMRKGSRFIWYNWIKKSRAKLYRDRNFIIFEGSFEGYKEIGNNIVHNRKIKYDFDLKEFEIVDEFKNSRDFMMHQHWHYINSDNFIISSDSTFEEKKKGWYSTKYGVKEESNWLIYKSKSDRLTTKIKLLKIK